MKFKTNLKKWLSVLMSLALVMTLFSGLAFGTKAEATASDFTFTHNGTYEMSLEEAQVGPPATVVGDSISLNGITYEKKDSGEWISSDDDYLSDDYPLVGTQWVSEPGDLVPGSSGYFKVVLQNQTQTATLYSQQIEVTITGGDPPQPLADFSFTHNGAYEMSLEEAQASPPATVVGDSISLNGITYEKKDSGEWISSDDDYLSDDYPLVGTQWVSEPGDLVPGSSGYFKVVLQNQTQTATLYSQQIEVTITGDTPTPAAPTITFNHEGGYRYTQDELLAILVWRPDPVLGDSITVNDATYQYTDLLPGAVFVDDKNENPFEDVVTAWIDRLPPVEKGKTYYFKYKVSFMPKFLPEGCEEGVYYESAPVPVYILTDEEEAEEALNRAKTLAIEDLRLYKQAEVDRGDYDQGGVKQINGIKDHGISAIENADSIAEINALLALAKKAIDLVEPKAPTPTPTPDPEKTDESTGIQPGASEASVDKFLTGRATDSDPKGSTVAPLKLVSKKQGKSSIKLNWSRVRSKGAVKYVLYGNRCGKKNKLKKITSLKGKTRTLKKIHGKKLKKGTYYKFIIVAYDSQNKVVATSKVIHVATKGGKVGNHKYVTVKSKKSSKWKAIRKASVKVGKTKKLKAKAKKASHKKVQKHRGVIWESSNTRVATVNNKGVVKGVSKGSCTVYAYAQCGVYKAIKITVK